MSEKAEFVLIERKKGRKNQFMAKKTSSRYYLNYGRTIPVGNQQAFRPADLKVGMIIEGNFKQGVIIKSIEVVIDNKGENHYKVQVAGETAGGEHFEFSEYQTVIADKEAKDLLEHGLS